MKGMVPFHEKGKIKKPTALPPSTYAGQITKVRHVGKEWVFTFKVDPAIVERNRRQWQGIFGGKGT